MQISPGEIFGLLGRNCAGKIATIEILTALAQPTRGTARIRGIDVVRQPLDEKKLIGVCPQEINPDRELTSFENLWIYRQLHRTPAADLLVRGASMAVLKGTSPCLESRRPAPFTYFCPGVRITLSPRN